MKKCSPYIFLASVLLSSFSLCAGGGPSNCGQRTESLKAGSNYRTASIPLASDFGHPPYEVPQENGRVSGFDVEVACEIQNRLGFRTLFFMQSAFSQLIPSAGENQNGIDIGLAALSITADRLQEVDFVSYSDDIQGVVMTQAFLDSDLVTPEQRAALLNPDTVLATLNTIALNNLNGQKMRIAVVGTGAPGAQSFQKSRQQLIIEKGSLTGNAYPDLVADPFVSVSAGLINLRAQPVTPVNPDLPFALFTDGPTAVSLGQQEGLEAVTNVQAAASADVPSQGFGIAIPKTCCKLYVDIREVVMGMIRTGKMAQLREQFGLTTPFTLADMVDLTPAACQMTQPTTSSLFNYLRAAFCGILPVTCNPQTQDRVPAQPALETIA